MTTLQIVFLVLAACLSLVWLLLAVVGPPSRHLPGVIAVLRYGTVLRAAALAIALAPSLIMIYAVAVFPWKNDSTLAIAGLSFLATSLVAGLPLLEVVRTQITLAEDGITRRSPWTGTLTLAWSEVTRVRYSTVNRWYVVSGAGRTIRVSRHLVGIETFVELVHRKVAADRRTDALP